MSRTNVALILSAIGILLFLAGVFNVLSSNFANFGGTAFIILAGLAWAFWRK